MKLENTNQRTAIAAISAKLLVHPAWILIWPVVQAIKYADKHFFAYLLGRVARERNRVSRIKFIWYGDSVYLHPMIWGSGILYLLAYADVLATGWLLLLWYIGLAICYITIVYNFNVVKTSVLATTVLALLGAAYFSTIEFAWNPLAALAHHVHWMDASVTPGFFLASSYVFFALIICEVVWAWLFRRVEIDESYVYEHQCLQGTSREPIFARGLKRETKDLLELLILGAADIQHRTRSGAKRFKNVPFASLWLGTAIDALMDVRGQRQADEQSKDDADEQVRISDAMGEMDDADFDDDEPGEEDAGDDDGEF